jgi:hypothetical protein
VLRGLSIELPAEAVEAIAVRAAELLATRQSRWLYGDKAAAEYLGWPVGRVTKLRQAGTDLYVVVQHIVAVTVQKGFDLMAAVA